MFASIMTRESHHVCPRNFAALRLPAFNQSPHGLWDAQAHTSRLPLPLRPCNKIPDTLEQQVKCHLSFYSLFPRVLATRDQQVFLVEE